jgi:hypothetical protein
MNKFEELIMMVSGSLGLLLIMYLVGMAVYHTIKATIQREEGKN